MMTRDEFLEALDWLIEQGFVVWTGEVRHGERVYEVADEYREMDQHLVRALISTRDTRKH